MVWPTVPVKMRRFYGFEISNCFLRGYTSIPFFAVHPCIEVDIHGTIEVVRSESPACTLESQSSFSGMCTVNAVLGYTVHALSSEPAFAWLGF